MTTRYKLTDADARTHGGMQWGMGVHHKATGTGVALCSNGWIHCYDHPLLAAFLNPIGANFADDMRLWEFVPDEGTPELDDNGLKRGVRAGTTVREIPVPQMTMAQRVRAAILVVKQVYGGKSKAWDTWAEDWLAGKNKSTAAADAAYAAAAAANAAQLNLVALIEQAIREEPA